MIVRFNVDSGANINSCKSIEFDLSTAKGAERLGYTKEEWLALSETEKQEMCTEWANNYLEIYFEEEGE